MHTLVANDQAVTLVHCRSLVDEKTKQVSKLRFVWELGDGEDDVFDGIDGNISADIEMKREDFLQDRTEAVRHDDEETGKVASVDSKISGDSSRQFCMIEEAAKEAGTTIDDVLDDGTNTKNSTIFRFVDEDAVE